MTDVRFDARQLTGQDPAIGPVAGAFFDITPGRTLTEGGYLLTEHTLKVPIRRTDDGVKVVSLPVTPPGEWLQIVGHGFKGATTWYVQVPDSGSVVDFTTLIRDHSVDPNAGDPIPPADSPWKAYIDQLVGDLNAAIAAVEASDVDAIEGLVGTVTVSALKTALSLPADTAGALSTEASTRAAADAALLAKPTVRPNTIAAIGDSITFFNGAGIGLYDPAVATPYFSSQGYLTWALAALGGRLTLLRSAGVGGERTDQMLARMSDVLALPETPGYTIFAGGSNNALQAVSGGYTSASVIADWQTAINLIRAAGSVAVIPTIPGFWYESQPAIKAVIYESNAWLRKQKQPGLIVCDWSQFWQSAVDGSVRTGFHNGDGIHPSILGAQALGKALADVLRPHITGHRQLVTTNVDPTNFVTNAMMLGTAGTLGSNAVGALADSWNAARISGTGIVECSKRDRTDGIDGQWQDFALTGGPGRFNVYQNVAVAGLAAGQKWRLEVAYDGLASSAMTMCKPTLAAYGGGSGGGYALVEGAPDTMPIGSGIPAGVLQTPPITLTGTPTGLQILFDIKGDGMVGVSRIGLKRVA